MTVTQAAKRIGISASKLYQLVAGRRVPHYRIGGKIIFTDDDIAAFMAGCRVGVVQAPPPAGPRRQVKLKHLRLS